MPRSSTTSFAVAAEPAASPRATAAAAVFHLAAAAAPWLARVPAPLAIPLSLLALAGLALTVARLPGRHAALAALALDGSGCRVRLRGSRANRVAEIGTASRAYAALVLLEVRVGGRRYGWLLPRDSLPPAAFRRLKARIRLNC
jgi:hypothetical protein